MSWNAYTDLLVGKRVDLPAIHSKEGAPWAQVQDFMCTPEEIVSLVKALRGEDMSITTNGITLANIKWTYIRGEHNDFLVLNSKAGSQVKGKDAPNMALAAALSEQAVVVGASTYEDMKGQSVLGEVLRIRDYLKGSNY